MATPFQPIEGKYEILEKMREGGMGTLYKVRHRLLDEVRVIKVMRPHLAEDENLRARFLREARTVIRLRHPNIAQLYDFTVDSEGRAFIVMEYIEGLTLQEMLRNGVPSLGLGLELADQGLRAVAYLHRRGVIHRDIAPDNLMVTRDEDGAPQVKLIDLGIAKVIESGASGLTTTGTFLGKVRYSSPEHFASAERGQIEPRSDLYSFGVVLYELLTGRYPIHGSSTTGLIAGHLVHPPMEFAESDPQGRVPETVREVILAMLAKRAEDRPQDADAVRARLREVRREHPWRPADLEAAFAVPVTARIPVVRPGSTQERLDREFGAAGTPSPAGSEPAASRTAPLEELSGAGSAAAAAQVRALLLGAERLVETGCYDEARLQLDVVLRLDAGHPEAARLVQAIGVAEERRRDRARAALERARTELAAGRLTQARRELDAAVADDAEPDRVEDLQLALREGEAERVLRRQRLGSALAEAARLLAGGECTAAERPLEEAAEVAPEDAEVGRLRQELDDRRRQRAAERSEAAARVAALADGGDLGEARAQLEAARRRLGACDELEGAGAALERAEADQRRRHELEEHLAAAAAATDEDAFVTALEAVENARQAARSPAERDQVAAAEQAVRAAMDAARQRQEVAAAVARVTDALAGGDLDGAERALGLARKLHREDGALSALAAELEERRAGRRRERVRELEGAAAAALQRGEAAEALAAARAALELDPGSRAAAEAVERGTDLAHQRALERQRTQVAAVAHEVGEHLEHGRLEEARRALEVAERVLGGAPELGALRAQLEAARRERVRELLESAFAAGTSFRRALACLEEARELDPADTRVAELLARTRAAAADLKDRRQED